MYHLDIRLVALSSLYESGWQHWTLGEQAEHTREAYASTAVVKIPWVPFTQQTLAIFKTTFHPGNCTQQMYSSSSSHPQTIVLLVDWGIYPLSTQETIQQIYTFRACAEAKRRRRRSEAATSARPSLRIRQQLPTSRSQEICFGNVHTMCSCLR